MTAFICSPGDAIVPTWFKVRDGLWGSVPLLDGPSGLYSRLTYREALTACQRLGVRLPTALELDAIRDCAIAAGFCLSPVTLPDLDMLHALGIKPGSEAADALRNARMGGAGWAELHDRRMADQLIERKWLPGKPVFNIGKGYIAGAPRGRAWLQGWWVEARTDERGVFHPAHYIQKGHNAPGEQGPHSDVGSRDYGTTTVVVMSEEPSC